jgi:hypothetical protein
MTSFTWFLILFLFPLTVALWAFYFFCRSKRGEQWLDKHFE